MNQENNAPNQCPFHNLEYLAVDISPICEKEARFLCLKCLATPHEKQYVKSLDEAKINLLDIKNGFYQRKQNQRKNNLEIFKNLISIIQQMKIYYSTTLDKILGNLEQQEEQITKEQECLTVQLEQVDLNAYFSQNYELSQVQYDTMKGITETQIDNIKSYDWMNDFQQQLSKIDDSIITLDPNLESNPTINKKLIQRTPCLSLGCQTHQMEIIYFDLNDQRAKENRIACALCVSNKLGPYTNLLSAQKQWQDLEIQKTKFLESQLDNGSTKIQTAQSQLKQLLNIFELKIKQVETKLADNLRLLQGKQQDEFKNMNKDWLYLSRDEILQIVDTLSKPQPLDTICKLFKEDFNKDNEEFNSLMNDLLKYLTDSLYQCDEAINQQQEEKKRGVVPLKVQQSIFTIEQEKKQNLSTAQQLNNELCEQIEQLQVDLSACTLFSEQLQLNLKQLEEEKENNYQLNQDKFSQLNNQIQEKENINFSNQKHIEELREQKKVLENSFQNQQKAIQQLKTQIQKMEQQKQEQNIISNKNQEELRRNLNTIEQLNQQLKELTQEKQIEQNQNRMQIEQNSKLTEEQSKINQIKIIFDESISQKDLEIIHLKQEANSLKTDLANKKNELESLKKINNEIIKEIEDQRLTLNSLRQKEIQYQQKIQNLNITILEHENQLSTVKIETKQEIKQEIIVSLKEKPYEQVKEYTKKQSDCCFAIALNREETIMVAGCGKNITVFEFKEGQLNQQQILSNHSNGSNIHTLYFMSKYNQFISGTEKGEIGIWSYNNTTKQYYLLQMLKQAHQQTVNRVIMNKNEDLIISCSRDESIKFWIANNEWECSQTLINHTDTVWDICLNETCTQLVSCGEDKQILISSQGGDQKWNVIQSIKGDGVRICYISDNLIAFQPWKGSNIEIYQLDYQNKYFLKYKNIPVNHDGHSCQSFYQCNSIIINNFQLIKIVINNEFILEQSINLNTNHIYGTMTVDFRYLITWDNKSKEFQVRKQK